MKNLHFRRVVEAVTHCFALLLCLLSDRLVGLEGEGRRHRMSRLGVGDRAMKQGTANAQDRQVWMPFHGLRICMAYDSLAYNGSSKLSCTRS